MLRRREVIGWSILALIIVGPLALWGADGEVLEQKTPIARLEVQPARVDWLPHVDYEHLTLTVAGPGDFYIQREFSVGEMPSFSSLDVPDGHLSDGVYAYELRAVPRSEQEPREKPVKARETADDSVVNEFRKGGRLPEGHLVQSGHIWVQEGSFVGKVPLQPSPSRQSQPEAKPPLRNLAAKTTVPDDLVVQEQACIGPNCMEGDADGQVLRLKEMGSTGLLQIRFEALNCCNPGEHQWALQANDGFFSGDFLIRDLTNEKTMFRIGANAPHNAFTISSNGNIGLGTSTPGAKLHLFGTATADVFGSAGPNPLSGPAFNFGYGGTSFGRGAAFLNTRADASAVAPNPSLRFLTADVQRMIITNAGNVGIGTTNPGAKLEVSGGEVRFPAGVGGLGFTHFVWPGDGKNYIRGTTIIADNGGSVGIGTTAPSSRLHVNGGDIRVSGGSFIDDGVTLNAPDYVFEPSYKLMPLEELRKFVTQEKHLPNVPNAREVKEKGLNLSQFQMRLLEKVEELTLYTLTQDERLTTQQEELLRLHEQNALLQERLAALEKAAPSEEPE